MDSKNKRIESSYWRGVNVGALHLFLSLHAWSGVKEGNYWKAGALSCGGMATDED